MSKKYTSLIEIINKIYESRSTIPLHAPIFFGNEKKYLSETIDSTFVSTAGKYVTDFEILFANFTCSKYAIATSSGTSALHIALIISGCVPNSEVITQSISFVATANAIKYCGAEPIFIDVDKDSMGMSPESLSLFLQENCEIRNDGYCWNKKTNKSINVCLPMHTYGFPNRIDKIRKICEKFNITLVEDSAESLGSFYNLKHTGTYGKVSTFSFNGNKIITTGGGGMIITEDENLARKAKHLVSTAKLPHKWDFLHDEVGYNYRMPNLNAALGLAQMEQFHHILIKKKEIAMQYMDWSKKNNMKLALPISKADPNYWLNILIADDLKERNKILKITNDNNIFTRPTWKLLHKLPMFNNCQTFYLKNTNWLEDRIVCLPSSAK